MKKNISLLTSVLIFLTGLCLANDLNDSLGKITHLTESTLTLREHDYNTGQDVTVEYELTQDISLAGADNLDELKTGQAIEITYVVEGEKRIATGIIVRE